MCYSTRGTGNITLALMRIEIYIECLSTFCIFSIHVHHDVFSFKGTDTPTRTKLVDWLCETCVEGLIVFLYISMHIPTGLPTPDLFPLKWFYLVICMWVHFTIPLSPTV